MLIKSSLRGNALDLHNYCGGGASPPWILTALPSRLSLFAFALTLALALILTLAHALSPSRPLALSPSASPSRPGRFDYFFQEYRRDELGIPGCRCVPPTPTLFCREKNKSAARGECRGAAADLEAVYKRVEKVKEGSKRNKMLAMLAKDAMVVINHVDQSSLFRVDYKGRNITEAARLYGANALLEVR